MFNKIESQVNDKIIRYTIDIYEETRDYSLNVAARIRLKNIKVKFLQPVVVWRANNNVCQNMSIRTDAVK